MAYDIFISYRRVDKENRTSGTNIARTIKQQLEIEGYKDRVFFDYSELNDDEFEKVILSAIEECKVFILVLTKDSMMRCVNESDWVRREILHARKCGLKIIPIEPDTLFNGYPENFPAELNVVKSIQHSKVHMDSSFERDIQAMIKTRISKCAPVDSVVQSRNGALVRIDTDLECRVIDFGKEIAQIGVGLSEIRLSKGKHKLSFVGVESDAERYDCMLDIRDIEYEEYVEIRLLDQYNKRKEAEKIAKEKAEAERKAKMLKEGGGRYGFYKVGDYYYDGINEGVVFDVWGGGRHGKIVSLDQAELQWCTDSQCEKKILVGADSITDGKSNTDKVMARDDSAEYPAFVWCRNKGKDWYLPASEELQLLLTSDSVHDAVNKTLESRGAAKLLKQDVLAKLYQSSSEEDELHVWSVFSGGTIDEYFINEVILTNNSYVIGSIKALNIRARAVAQF